MAGIDPEIGLALSGGGFRSTLFQLGTLWRLNELGVLPKIDRICSVSGGSIAAAWLGLRWKDLEFDKGGVATNFADQIVQPLKKFCASGVDVSAGIQGLFSPTQSIGDRVVARYRDGLFGHSTLQDLPSEGKGPRFIIYATNLQTGSSFRFSKPYLADYKLGRLKDPVVPLSVAVAASSAFPPVFSPITLETDVKKWEKMDGSYLFDQETLRRKIFLTDGGVYDNMGLEAVWDRCQTVLVSDAGAPLETQGNPSSIWTKQTLRCLNIITQQTRALRKRKLIADFKSNIRKGAYWGITTRIANYDLPDSIANDDSLTASLQLMRTRLNSFSDAEQGHLINWGYALTDSAMRKHVLSLGSPPGEYPIKEYPLNKI